MKAFMVAGFCCVFLSLGCQQADTVVTDVDRYAALIAVKPEYEERYIILHKNAFPQVLEAIYEANIINYSIFLHDGLLFSYFEYAGNDFDADMGAIAQDSTSQEWWKLTDPMQKPLTTRKEGEWWASMDSFFGRPVKSEPSKNCQRFAVIARVMPGHRVQLKRILGEPPESFLQHCIDHSIQNVSLFAHADYICLYYEYNGKEYAKDIRALQSKPIFKTWKDEIYSHLCGEKEEAWTQMRSVFYTP
ncbi:L-rhamnose mutarotase [candidate division KSB1 bacterium]|nr:L-rhamnose mutarotase [candidate division KSB1 bacterium]